MYEVNKTWEEMKPSENETIFHFEKYYERISKDDDFKKIPKLVFKQWIFGLHENPYTLYNYAWLNYRTINFKLCEWKVKMFDQVNVINVFKPYVDDRSKCKNFSQFNCKEIDLKNWIELGTWRIPPIILDVCSINSKIPKWSEIYPPYQLVEGHTRLAYLFSMISMSKDQLGTIASKHKIYLMSQNE